MGQSADPASDFDFLIGSWRVRHRRLERRLSGCTDWVEFSGSAVERPILGGRGNVEENEIDLPGDPYTGVALRAFDPKAGTWAIHWLDSRDPSRMDPPLIGRFEDGIGTFYAADEFEGRPIRVRFIWSQADAKSCRWEQAFSADGGASWETNWTMEFSRL